MYQIPFLMSAVGFVKSKLSTKKASRIGKKGMDFGILIKILLWIVVLVLVTAIIIKYIAGTGNNPLPGEDLLK